jgi:FKBP-type peptidyl-prolyl cis-trans isomerase FklB
VASVQACLAGFRDGFLEIVSSGESIMKKLILVMLAFALAACGQNNVSLKNTTQKGSYALGFKAGERMHATAPEIDVDAFVAGVKAGAQGKGQLTDEEMDKAMNDFRKDLMANREAKEKKDSTENLAKAESFLKENANKKGVQTLPDGIQYIVEKSGDPKGASPTLDDTVVADYEGTLLDGTVFDSSIKRGQPATFPLAHVIEGWQATLVHMHVGDKWKVFIPPKLAYGEAGAGGVIGPNELLVFEITLDKVIKGDAKAGQEKPANAKPAPAKTATKSGK